MDWPVGNVHFVLCHGEFTCAHATEINLEMTSNMFKNTHNIYNHNTFLGLYFSCLLMWIMCTFQVCLSSFGEKQPSGGLAQTDQRQGWESQLEFVPTPPVAAPGGQGHNCQCATPV